MRIAVVMGVSIALAALSGASPAPADAAGGVAHSARCSGLAAGPVRTVSRVIDGETLALDDGSVLRLIGALAPRAIDTGAEAGTWPWETRTRDALRALVLGKSVELAFGGDRNDRYQRLLAQAYLVEGDQRRWVQGHLLAEGLSRAYEIGGNRACTTELLAAERSARDARRGLWAEAAYQVRQADRPIDLAAYRTTFQIVEGRVERVAFVRGLIYLNFGRNWRTAFSVSLKNAERFALGDYARDPKGLEGTLARVRGWIETPRGRPMIDLSVAGAIEFAGAPVGGSIERQP